MTIRSPRLAGLLLALALAAPAGAATIDDLAWMSGSWTGTQGETRIEEHWTAPAGGTMFSVHRDVRDGRTVSFEFLRIVARGETLTFVAMPRGRNETAFPLKELGARRVVFENLAHDFPQRVAYWQTRPGELRARVEGMLNGKVESEEWVWKRGKLAK